jgi:hypothetical protein
MIESLDADCPACGMPVALDDVERIATSLADDGTCVRCLRSRNETARKRAEIEREINHDRIAGQRGDPVTPANLKRSELTVYAKRWQLWGLGIKGTDADELLARLYGESL